MCSFQSRFSSICIPKRQTLSSCRPYPHLLMPLFPIFRLINLSLECIRYLLLSGCSVNLFNLNHSLIFSNSVFIKDSTSSLVLPDPSKLESSANLTQKSSVWQCRSIMYILNRVGPKTLPWGTPILIQKSPPSLPLTIITLFLFPRYLVINFIPISFSPILFSLANNME